MLWFPEWKVLVVDDEPDVLQVTKMAMRSVEVDGVPVKIYTASSKAEAIEMLNTHFAEPGGLGLLTVALIDVVMETDSAGLELCDYIRNTMGNSVAQLYIRTGQAGVAPERAVIDAYDITGYFTKVEATEDKLYTIIKSGVRQYIFNALSVYSATGISAAIDLSLVSQDAIGETLGGLYTQLITQRGNDSSGCALWVGDTLLWSAVFSPEEAETLRDELLMQPITPVGPNGEGVIFAPDMRNGSVYDGMIVVPEGPNHPTAYFLSSGAARPKGNFLYWLSAVTVHSIATLWHAAGQQAYA